MKRCLISFLFPFAAFVAAFSNNTKQVTRTNMWRSTIKEFFPALAFDSTLVAPFKNIPN
jgi:hypothetical protein